MKDYQIVVKRLRIETNFQSCQSPRNREKELIPFWPQMIQVVFVKVELTKNINTQIHKHYVSMCFWWLVELPSWFKSGFTLIFWGIFFTWYEEYNFTQNEIQRMLGQIEYRKTQKSSNFGILWVFSSFWIFGSIWGEKIISLKSTKRKVRLNPWEVRFASHRSDSSLTRYHLISKVSSSKWFEVSSWWHSFWINCMDFRWQKIFKIACFFNNVIWSFLRAKCFFLLL